MSGPLTNALDRRALRRWARAADEATELDPENLVALRARARALSKRVGKALQIAEGRLQLPLAGQAAIARPMHSDWAWRPEIWSTPVSPSGVAAVASKTGFGQEARVFHDCPHSEITLRQVRNTRPEDVAPYGLRVDVFRFEGSFLSLVIDLPCDATEGLTRSHIIRLGVQSETESPLEIFGRLNVKHGPNIEQVVREFDRSKAETMVEFDLAASDLHERRVDRAWLDLIFEGPHMNQIILSDVTLSRRPRAEV